MSARVAVLQFPGVNCEAETVRALERAGLGAEVWRWTRLAAGLADFDAYVLPGGFSYQDRVRAGALAAKHPMVEVLGAEAERGKPVLGICNGAQVLVEAGLVPGAGVTLALARNRMPGRSGYYARWVYVRVEETPCVFTRGLPAGEVLALPVAHGEGRFTSAHEGHLAALVSDGRVPLRYCDAAGAIASEFPDHPNGAEESVAAVCNPAGNVMAMMPHPERAQDLLAVARPVGGAWGRRREAALDGDPELDAAGPGLAIFRGLAARLGVAR